MLFEEVLKGVSKNEIPSSQNEALRQALSTRGGAISAAFAYADAAEVLELLLDALENDLDDWRRPCVCGVSARAAAVSVVRRFF